MSTLLEKASLVMIPSGYKEDVVYSEIPTDGSGDIQFTRASDGTRVNSQGLVERVPWNLVEQSNTFNVTWATSNASVTSGQSGYDGSSDAWLLSKSAAGGRIQQTLTTSTINTFSVYAKAGTNNWLATANPTSVVYFNLSSGTVGNIIGSNVIDAKIEDVGNGWYRCIVVHNASTTNMQIYVADGNGNVNGTSGSIYIQDAQLNIGSTAKPYFPTTDRLNVPRLDYSNGCPSLLLEPQRTNLYPYSEDLSQWTTSGSVTVTANDASSPDGTTNADRVQFSADTDMVYYSGTGSAGTNVVSVYAKAKSGTAQKFRFFVNGATLYSSDLTATDQWQRFEFVYTYSAQTVGLRGATTGASDVLFWGFQHEIGSYPTSYIPTTSASVTRVADATYKTGISSLIGQTEGTIFVDFQLNQTPSDINGRLLQLWETNDTTNSIIPIIYQSLQLQITMFGANVGSPVIPAGASTLLGLGQNKIAIAYTSASVVVYRNGVLFASGNPTGFFPTSLTSLDLGGSSFATRNLSNPINQAAIFKTRLTNAELAAITSL